MFPIGLDSGQDIANLLLFYYEFKYIKDLSERDLLTARKFSFSFRYIDDLLSANFPEFHQHLPNIYPAELVLNKSNQSNTNVDYLDIKITSENNTLSFSLFDKRDNFNFDIVNFPYLDSCIPRKPALGIFYGQMIRIARICSKYEDFLKRINNLSKRLMNQGYKKVELNRLASRFFREKNNLIEKYKEKNIPVFLRRAIFNP